MFVESFPVGPLACNCTILACEQTGEALVIDPGDEAPRILEVLKQNQLELKALIHTHAHFDHVCATGGVQEGAGGQIALHAGDQWLYENVAMQAQLIRRSVENPPPPDRWLVDGDVVLFGEERVEVIHTPGHTPGSVCFMVPTLQTVFTGDTLFARGIGRTDLWGGSYEEIIRSIQERLLPLEDDLHVIAGHGPATRIGAERVHNPFLQSLP